MSNALPAALIRELAPHGRLRAAINFGNIVLAQEDPVTGEALGVTPVLARELARRLGVALEIVPYNGAGTVFAAAKTDAWDICFLAVDPVRSEGIAFSPPYAIIEGTYMVREASPLREVADVDAPGIRVAVSENSAYDLYLTRSLKSATIVRAKGTAGTFELFTREGLEVMAGVRQPLEKIAAAHPGLRVMGGRFTEINQAMGTPLTRQAASRYLADFIEEMKASGVVARALSESGQTEATVAPPGRG